MHWFPAFFFFNFMHFVFRWIPGNFLRSSLPLCHAATDVISKDDKAEPLQTKKQKLLVRCSLGDGLALGTACPVSLKDLRPVWFEGLPIGLCQPLERERGLGDATSTLSSVLLLALEVRWGCHLNPLHQDTGDRIQLLHQWRPLPDQSYRASTLDW